MHKVSKSNARENKSGHHVFVDVDAAVGGVVGAVGRLGGPQAPVKSFPGVPDTNDHAVGDGVNTHSERVIAGPCEQFIF
jgi:hypothetical protein